MSQDRQRLESLLWHSTHGGIVGDEAEEMMDLYRKMRDSEAKRRRAAVQRDRKRAADLVRAFLAPVGAELTPDAARLIESIESGARVAKSDLGGT